MTVPILQFGTGRLLQAHVDLFVAEARRSGRSDGPIAVVQTTDTPDARRRVEALKTGRPVPVRVQGVSGGRTVDETVMVDSVARALHASDEWPAVRHLFREARWIVSNTADRGYEVAPDERADDPVPRSFPAKLLRLLHERWREGAPPPMMLPLELVPANGAVLRATVVDLARRWGTEASAVDWIAGACLWTDSLVDRIVSGALDPIGAVAEPYALWAMQDAPGFAPPCRHPAVTVTGDLRPYERLKLFILNLGHSWMAGRWLADPAAWPDTVGAAMADPACRAALMDIYMQEIVPIFAAAGMGARAEAYVGEVVDRFANPFLAHRFADIATNHAAKVERRAGGLAAFAAAAGHPGLGPRLRGLLGSV